MSEEIEAMMTKPPSRSTEEGQASNSSLFTHGLGKIGVDDQQHEQSSNRDKKDTHLTCWCHFTGIEELTTSVQSSLRAASGQKDAGAGALDMRCIYNKGSTSVKVVTAGG